MNLNEWKVFLQLQPDKKEIMDNRLGHVFNQTGHQIWSSKVDNDFWTSSRYHHLIIKVELENNAGKDGTIIWILISRNRSGQKMKNGCFIYLILSGEINGQILLNTLLDELTIQLKIIGTPQWRKKFIFWMFVWKLWRSNSSQKI